jgi:hypothetical protein
MVTHLCKCWVMTVESSRAYVWASAPPCYMCPLPPARSHGESGDAGGLRAFAFFLNAVRALAHTRAILRARRARHAWRHQ